MNRYGPDGARPQPQAPAGRLFADPGPRRLFYRDREQIAAAVSQLRGEIPARPGAGETPEGYRLRSYQADSGAEELDYCDGPPILQPDPSEGGPGTGRRAGPGQPCQDLAEISRAINTRRSAAPASSPAGAVPTRPSSDDLAPAGVLGEPAAGRISARSPSSTVPQRGQMGDRRTTGGAARLVGLGSIPGSSIPPRRPPRDEPPTVGNSALRRAWATKPAHDAQRPLPSAGRQAMWSAVSATRCRRGRGPVGARLRVRQLHRVRTGRRARDGVELDQTTAEIASISTGPGHHPRHCVRSCVGRDAVRSVIGNVPFARSRHDPRHNRGRHALHYFLIKSLHLTRPGGLVVALTSRPPDGRPQRQLAVRWQDSPTLVGAIRLPSAHSPGRRAPTSSSIWWCCVAVRPGLNRPQRGASAPIPHCGRAGIAPLNKSTTSPTRNTSRRPRCGTGHVSRPRADRRGDGRPDEQLPGRSPTSPPVRRRHPHHVASRPGTPTPSRSDAGGATSSSNTLGTAASSSTSGDIAHSGRHPVTYQPRLRRGTKSELVGSSACVTLLAGCWRYRSAVAATNDSTLPNSRSLSCTGPMRVTSRPINRSSEAPHRSPST